ncbi:hypothetical protein Tel_17010 (plasmid) [Candidatus Tenderia electrophaga]|jgi:hypothetical protein|uniref:Uncharacterized protein n=1 Tax=Candidatus Tenderia electrophaga TaxID=1748243 RepID=A0A0S2TIH4_9GAMM|nr:hypothetical protein Tel_17010 [Candidatus Tenderia electrophaga]
MVKNPRTARVLEKAKSAATIRLSKADRSFLQDLSKTLIIDEITANQWHYVDRKHGARRRLDKLVDAGILERVDIGAPKGMEKITAWQFANKAVARAWGGDVPGVGGNRSHFHELLAGRAYFELGRPQEFRTASCFTADDKLLFGSIAPDAIAKGASGESILVEADSGHYTKRQIQQKQLAWQHQRQLWIQPRNAMARVPLGASVTAVRI